MRSWVVICLTVLILASAVFLLRHSQRASHPNAIVNSEDLLRADRANLNRKGALDGEVYGALVRLAQRQDPAAREAALARKEDPSPLIRSGVAQALGYFDDEEAFATVRGLLSDPQVSVRLQAIQGLTHRPGERRKAAARDLLARANVTSEERVAVAAAVLALQPSADERDQAIGALVHLTAEPVAKQDPRVALSAAIAMVSSAPTDARVEDALRGFLKNGTVPGVHDVAIRHLASARDPWLRANYRKLEAEPSPGVRLALIQSLHIACPEDRWQTLDWLLAQKSANPPTPPNRAAQPDLVRLAAVQEVATLGGPGAPGFLEKMLQDARFSNTQEIAQARDLLSGLRQNPRNYPDRCAGFPVALSNKEVQ